MATHAAIEFSAVHRAAPAPGGSGVRFRALVCWRPLIDVPHGVDVCRRLRRRHRAGALQDQALVWGPPVGQPLAVVSTLAKGPKGSR